MNEKTYNLLLVVLAVLLAVSIFFNGWLLYGRMNSNVPPENWARYTCSSSSECGEGKVCCLRGSFAVVETECLTREECQQRHEREI